MQGSQRRWTVISSGILVAALALIVMFTNSAAFFSPTAVAVVAAVGVMALMLQLKFCYPQKAGEVHLTTWFNLAGGILALMAFFRGWLHIRSAFAELITLAAIGCFGVSGALVLHKLRKRRTSNQPGD